MVVCRTEAARLVRDDDELDRTEREAIVTFLHDLPVVQGTENVKVLEHVPPEFAVLYLQGLYLKGLRDRSPGKLT